MKKYFKILGLTILSLWSIQGVLAQSEESPEAIACLEKDIEVVFSDGNTELFSPTESRHRGQKRYWATIDGDNPKSIPTPNPEKFLCPDPAHRSHPYAKANGGETYARNVCRQKLHALVNGCLEKKQEKIKALESKESEKEKDEKELEKNEEKAFRDEFAKWTEKTEDGLKISDETIDETLKDERQKLYSATGSGEDIVYGGEIGKYKGKSAEVQQMATLRMETLSNLLFEYQKSLEAQIETQNYKGGGDDTLESELQKLREVFDAYTDKRKEIDKKFDGAETAADTDIAILNAKIHYAETRINSLTQSLLVSGSSDFAVSQILTTKSNSNDVSKEGNLTLVKSLKQEQFCADPSNEDLYAEEWEKNCESNLFDKIIRLASQIVGTLGVILIIIASVLLITARGDETQTENGKQLILYTLGGLLVFFMSFIIVQFIIDLLVW